MKESPITAENTEAPPSAELVRSELVRLLKSDHFKNSKRCQTLLSYLVEETLAGHSDQLKERLVGINVFGRNPQYDTAEDPVVRNAAIEVRKRLAQSYVEPGGDSAVRIEMRAGTYVPEFHVSLRPADNSQPEKQHPAPNNRRRLAVAGLVFVALLGAAIVWLVPHFETARRLGAKSSPAPANRDGGVVATDNGDAVRILSGITRSGIYVDRFGNQWLSDRYFSGGRGAENTHSFFFPPADPGLFRSFRIGAFSYDIPLKPKQVYEMRLYFFEPQFRYGNKVGGDGENERLFQVQANGQVILDNFDIIKDADFASTTARAFRDIVAADDGKLHLQFNPRRSEALLNAIELLPYSGHSIPPIRIHAAPGSYTDSAGNLWSPDDFYIGGQEFDPGTSVTGVKDPDLFNVGRFGNFHYAIPVPPGRYSLTLFFAETWFHEPGQRVFDVSCNGDMLIRRLDIFQQVGFSHVLQKTFHGLEPNAQGKLMISFSPIVDYASVSALEIDDESH